MREITEKQAEIYKYIIEYEKEHLYPPAIREICEAVRLKSTSSVYSHLKSLEILGLIESQSRESRTIKLKGYTVVSNEVLIRLYEDYARKR